MASEGEVGRERGVEGEEGVGDEAVGVEAEFEDLGVDGEAKIQGGGRWGFGQGLEERGVMEVGV